MQTFCSQEGILNEGDVCSQWVSSVDIERTKGSSSDVEVYIF